MTNGNYENVYWMLLRSSVTKEVVPVDIEIPEDENEAVFAGSNFVEANTILRRLRSASWNYWIRLIAMIRLYVYMLLQ
jgi:hypothetical protein